MKIKMKNSYLNKKSYAYISSKDIFQILNIEVA